MSTDYQGRPETAAAGPAPARRRCRAWLRRVTALVIIATGASLIGYPFVSDWLNQQAQGRVAARQYQAVQTSSPQDLEAARQAATRYNNRVRAGGSYVVDPFDAQQRRPGNAEYEAVLNLAGDGVMAQLVIPKIDVFLPIYHYTNEQTLLRGIGHVVNTSVPAGGVSTRTILAGHTGLQSARMLDRLPELMVGDWFVVRVLGEDHAYRVIGTDVVRPEEVHSLLIEDGRDLVTLVTCTPYGVNSHRLLVHAERTEPPAEWTQRSQVVDRSVVAPTETEPGAIELAEGLWQAAPRLWLSTPLVPRAAAAGAAAAVVLVLLVRLVSRLRRRGS